MKNSFEIISNGVDYSVSPAELAYGLYCVMDSDGKYEWIGINEIEEWVEVDPFTNLRLGRDYDERINAIGVQIECYCDEN